MKKIVMLGFVSLFVLATSTTGFGWQCDSCGVSYSSGYPAQAGYTQAAYAQPTYASPGFAPVYNASAQTTWSQPVYSSSFGQQNFPTPVYASSAYAQQGVQNYPVTNSYVANSSTPQTSMSGITYASSGGVSSAPVYGNSAYRTYTMNSPVANSVPTTTYATGSAYAPSANTSAPGTYASYSPSYTTASYSPYASSSVNNYSTNVYNNYPSATYTSARSSGGIVSGLAQRKAQMAANMNLRGHVGGGYGGLTYEGVGWSNQGPQHAIQKCCYWGQRTPGQIGVSRGSDGCWYACVLYH